MGKIDPGDKQKKSLTLDDIKNKELIIKMLNYEENLTKSDYGKSLYKNTLNGPLVSLNIEKVLNKLTLDHFGFNNDECDVLNYRSIFRTYYKSPDNYDKDVLDAVHYMRENKCVYYKNKSLNIGDILPNCNIYSIDNVDDVDNVDNVDNIDAITKISLYDIIKGHNYKYIMFGAFSLS